MSSYLTLIGLLLLVLWPVLVPVFISATHAVARRRAATFTEWSYAVAATD